MLICQLCHCMPSILLLTYCHDSLLPHTSFRSEGSLLAIYLITVSLLPFTTVLTRTSCLGQTVRLEVANSIRKGQVLSLTLTFANVSLCTTVTLALALSHFFWLNHYKPNRFSSLNLLLHLHSKHLASPLLF